MAPAAHLEGLAAPVSTVRAAVADVVHYMRAGTEQARDVFESGARDFAFGLARTYVAALLIEHAWWSGEQEHMITAKRWCEMPLAELQTCSKRELEETKMLMQSTASAWPVKGSYRGYGPSFRSQL